MPTGIVLKSGSFSPGGETEREHNLKTVIKGAGYEVPEKTALPDYEDVNADVTNVPDDKRFEKNLAEYRRQVDAIKERVGEDEWDEAINQDIYIGQAAQLAILEHSNSAEICLHLGRTPDLAKAIGRMSPLRAAGAIGKLAADLPKPERVSKPVNTDDKSFSQIAQMKDWPGKAAALKRAARERR